MRRRVMDTVLLSIAAKQISPKSASNNQHLQFLSFYRLGIWIPLSCVAIKTSAERDFTFLRGWDDSVSGMVHSPRYGQKASYSLTHGTLHKIT